MAATAWLAPSSTSINASTHFPHLLLNTSHRARGRCIHDPSTHRHLHLITYPPPASPRCLPAGQASSASAAIELDGGGG